MLIGPPGTGKTYFCAAAYAYLFNKIPTCRAYNERMLHKRLLAGISDPTQPSFEEHLIYLLDDYLIMLDDIGATDMKEWKEKILIHAINYRYETMLPTIITSNLNETEFKNGYHERIHDRLFAKENMTLNLFGMESFRKQGL